MTCNDCLHCEACNRLATGYNIMQVRTCVCKWFSDKAEWVHFPCKVGTQVFFLRDKNNIIETSVEKIILKGKEGKGCYIKLECNAMYETSCQSIGKTVFFTREEAKKALDKRKGC